ncbi:MAG TPA: TlpA disulfide reductase family protein [Micromonosporaceae bacterium]|nr:TlpA disulfide reductase family protein [Micromonosporaceae bacterium]
MRWRSWRSAIVAAGMAAALAATGCSSGENWEEQCSTSPRLVIECAPGNRPPAPAVVGELLDGGSYDLAQERGKVVVVNFWGSWCSPCRAEIDDLEETYQATKEQGVAFLGINLRDDRDKATAFHSGRTTYPSLFDPGSRLALEFDVPPNAIPATVILDRAGQIAVVLRRPVKADELLPLVEGIAVEQSSTGGT